MATLRLFASIREAAGNQARLNYTANTVEELLQLAAADLGDQFKEQIQICRIWLNGQPVSPTTPISSEDEVALLPPVSGGSGTSQPLNTSAALNVGLISLHTSPFSQPGQGDSGGLNVYVRQLAYALAHRGQQCTVYVRKTSPDQPTELDIEPGVRLVHIEAGDFDLKLRDLPNVVDEFADAMADHIITSEPRIDLLHANYWLSAVAGHRLKHDLNLPLVTTFHTLGKVKESVGEWVSPGRIAAEEQIIQCSEAISAISKAEVSDLLRLYSADLSRVHEIPGGVNHAFFSPGNQEEARRALKGYGRMERLERSPRLVPNIPVLLFVGRIQPLKRLDLAVEALAELINMGGQNSAAELLVVGAPSGPDGETALAESLALAKELKVRSHIRHIPPQPHHLLSTYYRAADLVIMPSLSESFGLVALEAAACGTPVVASKVGGLVNLIDHNKTGVLVGEDTPKAFADAADSILSGGIKSAEMALDAVAKAKRYTWLSAAAQLESLYNKCLSASLLDC